MKTKPANRPVQPTVEDLYAPAHSARKLWKRIGKPHGQFRTWADQVIQPLLPSSEIRALSIPGKRGSPTTDYLFSTHIAEIILAQADTAEGRELLETMWAASRVFVTMGVEGVNELVMSQTPDGAAARERFVSAEAQAMGRLYDINEGRIQESPEFIPVQTLIDVISDHAHMIATALGGDPNLMPTDMAIAILTSLLGDDDVGRRELVEYLVYYDEVRALRGKMSQPR